MKKKYSFGILLTIAMLLIPAYIVKCQTNTKIIDGKEVTISNLVFPENLASANQMRPYSYPMDSENYYELYDEGVAYKVKWDGSSYEEIEDTEAAYRDFTMIGDGEEEEKFAVAECYFDVVGNIVEDTCEEITDYVYDENYHAFIEEDDYDFSEENYLITIYNNETDMISVIDINGNIVMPESDKVYVNDVNPALQVVLVFNNETEKYLLYKDGEVIETFDKDELDEEFDTTTYNLLVAANNEDTYYYALINYKNDGYSHIIDKDFNKIKTFELKTVSTNNGQDVTTGIEYFQEKAIDDVVYFNVGYCVEDQHNSILLDANFKQLFEENDYVYAYNSVITRYVYTEEEESSVIEIYDFDLNLIYSTTDAAYIDINSFSNFDYKTSIPTGKYILRINYGSTNEFKLITVGERNTINLNGVIKDKDGNYVKGVTVELHSRVLTTTTSDYGYFSINNAPVGEHELIVKDKDGETLAELPITLNKGDDTKFDDNNITYKDGIKNITVYLSLNGDDLSITKVVDGAINPKTSDNIIYSFILFILSIIAVSYIYKKRYN